MNTNTVEETFNDDDGFVCSFFLADYTRKKLHITFVDKRSGNTSSKDIVCCHFEYMETFISRYLKGVNGAYIT